MSIAGGTGEIRNVETGAPLARAARLADTLGWRMRGMIGRRFDGFDALVFRRCGSIHTFFMGIPLDVVFLDRRQRILGVRQGLRPWRLAGVLGARITVELPTGALEACPTTVGQHLFLAVDDWQNPAELGTL